MAYGKGEPGGQQEYDYLSGKVRWAKLFVPSQYNKYSLELNLDNASLGKALELKKRGIKNNIKNVDGEYWITLSSPSHIDTRMGPKIIQPPAVVNADGSDWDPKRGIGNGSDITCKVWIRKYQVQGKDAIAVRLYGVKVDNLIEFNTAKDFANDDRKRIQTSGLTEHSPQQW